MLFQFAINLADKVVVDAPSLSGIINSLLEGEDKLF